MVRLGRIGGGTRVLDAGCATGGLTASIGAATDARIVGCDHSNAMLDYARRVRRASPVRCAPSTRVIASLVVHQIPDRHVRTDLELFDEHRFGNGVVHLRYRVST